MSFGLMKGGYGSTDSLPKPTFTDGRYHQSLGKAAMFPDFERNHAGSVKRSENETNLYDKKYRPSDISQHSKNLSASSNERSFYKPLSAEVDPNANSDTVARK